MKNQVKVMHTKKVLIKNAKKKKTPNNKKGSCLDKGECSIKELNNEKETTALRLHRGLCIAKCKFDDFTKITGFCIRVVCDGKASSVG